MSLVTQRTAGNAIQHEVRLTASTFNRRLAKDEADAFQRLVLDLLRASSPVLRRFPTAGRDGAIDLFDDGPPRIAYQCKHVGQDGLRAVLARWKSVEHDLFAHLPKQSQSQYSPWWNRDRPIAKYVLCLSSKLANQAQRERVTDAMHQTFVRLAGADPRLRHLETVRAEVLDWTDLEAALRSQPSLLFRWFPRTRPIGLVPLEDLAPTNALAARLNEQVSYYSRNAHAARHPTESANLPTESSILRDLANATGAVVTGAGGAGKSRLVLEVGRLAESEGWVVLCVARTWRAEMVDAVAELATQDDRVLFVVDYVEMQMEFHDVVARIAEVNEAHGFQLRYIANSRAAYFTHIRTVPHQTEVRIGDNDAEAHYRRATTDHILRAADLSADVADHPSAPLIAAFASYLALTGRAREVGVLSEASTLGAWLLRSLRRTLADADPTAVMGVLIQVPMTASQHERLAATSARDVLRALELDGWIHYEPDPTGSQEGTWRSLHDVFVDELTVSALSDLASVGTSVIREAMRRARENGTLRSVALSLQRVRDRLELAKIDWNRLVVPLFDSDPAAWIEDGAFVLGGALVGDDALCEIVERHEAVMVERAGTPAVRQEVRAIARRAAASDRVAVRVQAALHRLSEHIASTTFDRVLLENLLRSSNDESSRLVLKTLRSNADHFACGFVATRWLRSGRPTSPVATVVETWLAEFGNSRAAATLMGAWLVSGGDFAVVRSHGAVWLERFATDPAASFLLKGIAKRGDEAPNEMKAAVLNWCRDHPDDPDALWRLTKLGWAVLRPEFVDETLEVAERVVGHHLAAPLESPIIVGQLTSLIGLLVSAIPTGETASRVDELLLSYLRADDAFVHDGPLRHAERPQFATRVASLIFGNRVDVEQDREGFLSFFRWAATWKPENRPPTLCARLRHYAPEACDIWELLERPA